MMIMDVFHPEAFTSSLICSAEGDDGGTGGAGGGGDALDDATRDLILRTVNAAVSNQLGRKLPTAIEQGVTAAISPLQDAIGQLTGPLGGGDGTAGGAGGKAGNGQSSNSDPRVAELLKQQEAMKNQLAAERKAREEQARAQQEQQTAAQLRDALAKGGVEPLRVRGALAVLRENIKRTDDGQLTYVAQRNGYTEDLALGDGIKDWLGTDEGKAYLAPKDVGGTGNAPGRTAAGAPRPGARPTDPAAARAQEVQQAREGLRSAVAGMLSEGRVDIVGPRGGDS